MNNPNYTPYSQQERHQIIDATVESSISALRIPEVATRLGGRTLDLLNMLHNVTVPNIHHGTVHPLDTNENSVPVIALHPEEEVQRLYKDLSFDSTQKQSLTHYFGQRIANEIIQTSETLTNRQYDNTVTLESLQSLGVDAYVPSSGFRVQTIHGEMLIRNRPIVILNAANTKVRGPAFTLHELTHFRQIQTRPLIEPEEIDSEIHAEEELEAYHVSAEVIRGYQDAGMHDKLQDSMDEHVRIAMLQIDEIRQTHQNDTYNPFATNKKITAALAASQLSIVHPS